MNREEYELLCDEDTIILGIDEAGVGPLAGPVVYAGVVFKDGMDEDELKKIRDSKKMSEKQRDLSFAYLIKNTHCAISIQSAETIDKLGITGAKSIALQEVYNKLKDKAEITIFDGNWDPINSPDFNIMIKADDIVKQVAAASVIAKVSHDKVLYEMAKKYPEYEFDKHKGYGTKRHRELIIEHGKCPEHRQTFNVKGYDDDPYRKRLKEETRVRNKMREYHDKKN
jgi:ribonuclease HII